MATYQQYLGRLTIGTSSDSFSVNDGGGAQALTLASGKYYIAGYTGEGTAQLVEHLQAKIRTATGFGAATVTYSYSTGKITFTFAGTTTITFTDSGLAEVIGFDGTVTSGASTYTGGKAAKYVWRPTKGLAEYPGQLNRLWAPVASVRMFRSQDFTAYGAPGNVGYEARLRYALLPEADVIVPSGGSQNLELEQFFIDVLSQGERVRIYPDRTLNASTSFYTALWAGSGDQDSKFADLIARSVPGYNGLWDADLRWFKVAT